MIVSRQSLGVVEEMISWIEECYLDFPVLFIGFFIVGVVVQLRG